MAQDYIKLRGVHVNNLKNINIDIPKGEITVFTGVSGSGKSSLVFDTIGAEAKRQMDMNLPMYLRRRMDLVERPDAQLMDHLSPSIIISQRSLGRNSSSTVATVLDLDPLVRLLFSRIASPSVGYASAYRRSDPKGQCPTCHGTGEIRELDEASLFNLESSLAENGINFAPIGGSWQKSIFTNSGLFDNDKLLKNYSKEEWQNLAYGPKEELKVDFPSKKTGQVFTETYQGLIPRFRRLYLDRDISRLSKKVQEATEEKLKIMPCKTCHGSGFSREVLESKINGYSIVDFYNMEVGGLLSLLRDLAGDLGQALARQIKDILHPMVQAGLDYLHLNRPLDSLSGGERQRLKLVSKLGSSLNNMTYILDEPSAGLHPYDLDQIKDLILALKDKKNTILLVEHRRELMALADGIIDMGPGAGSQGGQIVFQGVLEDFLQSQTLTARYLNRDYKFENKSKSFDSFYRIKDCHTNNLKSIDVSFPKKALSLVTGLAGSGKSSLVHGDFMASYPEASYIDQSGIGISSRSTPATYVNIMKDIRQVFAQASGREASMFSFNSKGACPHCKGKGILKPDLAFADPVTLVCEACQGTRYSDLARSYSYRGLNIVEVLDLTVKEAMDFFKDQDKIVDRLKILDQVGLGYVNLGQATSTLSGGELQRLKLGLELQKEAKTYILDEPTTGLHMADVEKLVDLFTKMVDQGNTVIVIDHSPDLMLRADWIVDLGPGPGERGGRLLYQGPARGLLNVKESLTGQYLKDLIDGSCRD